jgi:hypothetical protein
VRQACGGAINMGHGGCHMCHKSGLITLLLNWTRSTPGARMTNRSHPAAVGRHFPKAVPTTVFRNYAAAGSCGSLVAGSLVAAWGGAWAGWQQ